MNDASQKTLLATWREHIDSVVHLHPGPNVNLTDIAARQLLSLGGNRPCDPASIRFAMPQADALHTYFELDIEWRSLAVGPKDVAGVVAAFLHGRRLTRVGLESLRFHWEETP